MNCGSRNKFLSSGRAPPIGTENLNKVTITNMFSEEAVRELQPAGEPC